MKIGVVKETYPDEKRVAMVPAIQQALIKAGIEIAVEAGAGEAAGYPDKAYEEKGAHIITNHHELFDSAKIMLYVRGYGANLEMGRADLSHLHENQVVVGLMAPLDAPEAVAELAKTKATAFAMELMPRTTRAQSMDVLSSMATVAGYKAVLLAAEMLPKMFPMLMTAAGTVAPAKVFIIGAGVAGLQAIATARRLGATVLSYDVRPAVKEQVESLGAKFVEMELAAGSAEDKGGYAKAMGEDFYRKQRELMMKVVSECDVVISTAAVPGKKAPLLITKDMVQAMNPGSVIIDLAAERGGNCELTSPDQTVIENGVSIFGPLNLPATVPYHASQLYAKNMANFLLHLIKDGKLDFNMNDEIIRESMIVKGGDVVNPRIREILGLKPADLPERSNS